MEYIGINAISSISGGDVAGGRFYGDASYQEPKFAQRAKLSSKKVRRKELLEGLSYLQRFPGDLRENQIEAILSEFSPKSYDKAVAEEFDIPNEFRNGEFNLKDADFLSNLLDKFGSSEDQERKIKGLISVQDKKIRELMMEKCEVLAENFQQTLGAMKDTIECSLERVQNSLDILKSCREWIEKALREVESSRAAQNCLILKRLASIISDVNESVNISTMIMSQGEIITPAQVVSQTFETIRGKENGNIGVEVKDIFCLKDTYSKLEDLSHILKIELITNLGEMIFSNFETWRHMLKSFSGFDSSDINSTFERDIQPLISAIISIYGDTSFIERYKEIADSRIAKFPSEVRDAAILSKLKSLNEIETLSADSRKGIYVHSIKSMYFAVFQILEKHETCGALIVKSEIPLANGKDIKKILQKTWNYLYDLLDSECSKVVWSVINSGKKNSPDIVFELYTLTSELLEKCKKLGLNFCSEIMDVLRIGIKAFLERLQGDTIQKIKVLTNDVSKWELIDNFSQEVNDKEAGSASFLYSIAKIDPQVRLAVRLNSGKFLVTHVLLEFTELLSQYLKISDEIFSVRIDAVNRITEILRDFNDQVFESILGGKICENYVTLSINVIAHSGYTLYVIMLVIQRIQLNFEHKLQKYREFMVNNFANLRESYDSHIALIREKSIEVFEQTLSLELKNWANTKFDDFPDTAESDGCFKVGKILKFMYTSFSPFPEAYGTMTIIESFRKAVAIISDVLKQISVNTTTGKKKLITDVRYLLKIIKYCPKVPATCLEIITNEMQVNDAWTIRSSQKQKLSN